MHIVQIRSAVRDAFGLSYKIYINVKEIIGEAKNRLIDIIGAHK